MRVATLLAVTVLVAASAAFPRFAICDLFDQQAGKCGGASINGGGVDVGASQDYGGGDGSESPSGDGDWGSTSDAPGEAIAPNGFRRAYVIPDCGGCANPAPVVRITDLINFKPTLPAATMEPNGWAVIGLDANFYLSTGSEIKAGNLLGFRAEVRFTPGSITWDYGDGAVRTTADAGASWASLGLADFSPTNTSHVYQTAGDYTIRPSVSFTAEYRFGGQPWQAVSGTLDAPANQLGVVAGDAKTVLVDRDCTANPNGPGC
jgi:hypothetical protein